MLTAWSLALGLAAANPTTKVVFTWKRSVSKKTTSQTVMCGKQHGGPYTAANKSAGYWTQTLTIALPSGNYFCVATVTGPTGQSGASNEVAFTVN